LVSPGESGKGTLPEAYSAIPIVFGNRLARQRVPSGRASPSIVRGLPAIQSTAIAAPGHLSTLDGRDGDLRSMRDGACALREEREKRNCKNAM